MQWSKTLRAAARLAPEGCTAARMAVGRMRAWRVHTYGGLTELRLEEARVPPLRAPDDILVRVTAASINPIDIAMLGGYGARALNVLRAFDGSDDVEFPLVPGRDFVGIVERAGPDARLRPGQRVWGVVPPHRQGSHAEYVVVKDEWAGPAPSMLDEAAAGGALYAGLTACAALRVAGLGSRRPSGARPNVLLLGLGGVGQAALQLLAHRQAEVTVGCSGELTTLALQLGASQVLDRHVEDYDHRLETSGPYEVILDCAGLGGDEVGARAWRFSRYVTLSTPLLRNMDAHGVAPGLVTSAAALVAQSARAVLQRVSPLSPPAPGSLLPPHVRWAYFMPNASDIQMLYKLAELRKFTVSVEDVYPISAGDEAFARAAKGRARGKLVLDFTKRESNFTNRCE